MQDKNAVARSLIDWHFEIEPRLTRIYLIRSSNEDDPSEPIKLIEVNADTMATGSFEAYRFAPTKEIPYPTLIAEVTPQELEQFQATPGAIPESWDLSKAQAFERPRPV